MVLFPLGQFTTIPLPFTSLHIYIQDIILAFVWVILILYFIKKRVFLSIPLTKPISLFFVSAAFSLLINIPTLSTREFFISSLYLVRWIGFAGIFFAIYIILGNWPQRKSQLINIFIVTIFITSLFGILQYFLYPDLRNLYYLGWDPHYLRVFGTFLDPGFLGLIFVLGLNTIALVYLKKPQQWLIFTGIVIYISLALTYSRSSFLAFFISALYIIIRSRIWKILPFLVGIIILTFLLLPQPPGSEGAKLERTVSSQARIGSWEEGLNLIKRSPIVGLGFNTLRFTNKSVAQEYAQGFSIKSHSASGLENSFLFILATTGIIGFLSYLYLLIKIFIHTDTLAKVSLLAIVGHSFFNNSLFYPWVMFALWYIVGVGIKRHQQEK